MKKPATNLQPEPQGAAAALAWIASQEAQGRAELDAAKASLKIAIANREQIADEAAGEAAQRAVNRAKGDLDDAMERHFKLLKQLRDFDRSVAPEKRSAEETVTRDEGAQFVAKFVIYMRTATERIKESVPRIRECATNEAGFEMLDSALSEEFRNAMRMAVENEHLPAWWRDAMEGAL